MPLIAALISEGKVSRGQLKLLDTVSPAQKIGIRSARVGSPRSRFVRYKFNIFHIYLVHPEKGTEFDRRVIRVDISKYLQCLPTL